ncbi:tetratricopeptide repeat protein [Parvularcula sp. ZS-1/3]|uniref:Tetratricopeptide repeat protein n=1 Tax=Parvularcula mediterranea TaxID=2732508 RepID=A0A7Y3W400_9PROT|nr:tetratricopeptide repeat protein [Parvularcula mediterranea]NNU14994.1 tetratricopeptide repeat protein [Parvularcula mediterranea]
MSEAAALRTEGRLIGWKRIAAYLGCSERTARRWEAEEALPVHRQMHEAKSTVFALPEELDGWIASRAPGGGEKAETVTASGWQRPAAPALAVFAVALALAFFVLRTPGAPVKEAPLTEDRIALDLYERGVALWRQRGAEPNARAVRMLTEVVERDPQFAEGWSALASAWATYPTYSTDVSPSEGMDRAMMAAERALSLDPTLAEPRTLMVNIAQRQGDWIRSEEIFREALEADPENATILIWFAGHYRELGMFKEAFRLSEEARRLDPNAPPVLTEIAMNTLQAGDIEEGERLIDYILEDLGLETPIAWMGKFFALIERGDWEAAKAWVARTPFPNSEEAMMVFVDAERVGTEEASAQAVPVMREAYDEGMPAWIAYFMLDRLGEWEAALDVAEAETDGGVFETSVIFFDPFRPDARQTERFADIIESQGFIRYWREAGPPTFCKAEAETPVCQRIGG